MPEKVDFVLAFKPSAPMPDIESHILFQNCLAAIVNSSHPLAAEKKISLESLSRYTLALPSKGLQARNALDRITAIRSCPLKIHIELNDPNILLDLVRQSNLVTVLAEASIHNERGVTAVPHRLPRKRNVRLRPHPARLLPQTLHAGIHQDAQRVHCRERTHQGLDLMPPARHLPRRPLSGQDSDSP